MRVDAGRCCLDAAVLGRWTNSLQRVAGARTAMQDRSPVGRVVLASMLVVVHDQAEPSRRPIRDQSLDRHLDVMAALEPEAAKCGLPITWHAAWRLPPGLKITRSGEKPWLRFPAVSFVAAVHPLGAR